jgi:hypothetical protein
MPVVEKEEIINGTVFFESAIITYVLRKEQDMIFHR